MTARPIVIRLGDFVRDKVTGLEGFVLAKMEALFEAPQCRVHQVIPGAYSVWMESARLVVVRSKSLEDHIL
jgi:hypothetical protein